MSETVEVPTELVERCVSRMRQMGETMYRRAGGRGRNGERAERMLTDAAELATYVGGREPEEPERQTSEQLPPGYTRTHTSGGYYTVRDPNGHIVEGPSNGKWQGKDGAADGAWADYQQT